MENLQIIRRELDNWYQQTISVPRGHEFLDLVFTNGKIVLIFLACPLCEDVSVTIVQTRNEMIFNPQEYIYLGTYTDGDGYDSLLHVFIKN